MSAENSARDKGAMRSHLGDQGELWFAASLPRGWVWQPPRRDFGKDGLIVIRDGTSLHNIEFSVQIKSSDNPFVRDGYVLLKGIARSAIQYWFASPLPTLVVAVDITNRVGWYAWHLDLFATPEQLFGPRAAKVTVSIPQKNQLDEFGWNSIRSNLLDHFRSLQQALYDDAMHVYVLATIHNIARVVGNLMRIGSSAPPASPLTKSEGMTLLIEQLEIRNLIHSVRMLLDKISARSDVHKQIEFWLTSFEEIATSAHPSLPLLPTNGYAIPAGLKLAFAPKLLVEARPRLVLAGVDLLRLLTSPRNPTKDESSALS